jgi:hypothetical protein
MLNMRFAIAVILCVAAVQARAHSFEQQLFQISQNASVLARQNRRVFLNAQATAVQGQAQWQKVTGPDGTFTAEMPAAPKYSAIPQTVNGSGAAYTLHEYLLAAGAREFLIHTAIYPPSVDTSNPRATMQAGLDNTVKNLDNGKWISVTWTKHQGLTAVEAIGLMKGQEVRTYTAMRGQQIFVLIHIGPDGTARSDDTNRFIASLNIR